MKHSLAVALMGLGLWGLPVVSGATPIQLDIAGLDSLGPSILLGIDFIDGDGPSNSIGVSDFSTDGIPGSVTLIGGATIMPGGYRIDDSGFFNNLSVAFTGASHLSFQFTHTDNLPAPGGFADTLAVYLLDTLTGLPSIFTDEPLGTHALMSWSAAGTGEGELQVYGPLAGVNVSWNAIHLNPPNPVPEPSALPLWMLGVASLVLAKSIGKGRAS